MSLSSILSKSVKGEILMVFPKIVQLPLKNIVFFDRKRIDELIENTTLSWFINFFSRFVKEVGHQCSSVCGSVNKCHIEWCINTEEK